MSTVGGAQLAKRLVVRRRTPEHNRDCVAIERNAHERLAQPEAESNIPPRPGGVPSPRWMSPCRPAAIARIKTAALASRERSTRPNFLPVQLKSLN